MELLKLSRFRMQLRTLITEVRELREKERASSDQLHNFVQKRKQSDEEFTRKISQLETDLALSNELGQKLERRVQGLEDDNALLESKQKELKETISSLLQSKDGFIKAYEDSTYQMKRSIESRDRKIAMLSEKINAHLSLFDSMQKEASFVKQVTENAQYVLNEKEEVVAQLKIEVDKVSTFEKLFIEKIIDLETRLRSCDDKLQKKDRFIAELQTQLQMAKISDQCQSKIEEHQETLLAKEGMVQTLISENNALRSELGRLEITIKKIQSAFTHMDQEDMIALSLMPVNQEHDTTVRDEEDNRTMAYGQTCRANSDHETSGGSVAEITASPLCEEYQSISNPLEEKNFDSCVSEANCTTLVHQPDSECSTTQAGTS